MKKVTGIVLAVVLLTSLSALEVDRNEVEPGTAGAAIEFVNYNGPYTTIDTLEEILGIGSTLGSSVLASGSSGDRGRYYVIHAVDPAVKAGFDADILILGANAGVDHIDNLRRIIGSYLRAAYGYGERDSATLASFITVYNAVYRGKIDTFKARYKPVVTGYLTPDAAGLSVRYDEWPGRTQIVIPLSDARLAGTVSAIDTSTLTEKAVVDKLKEDAAKATDTRKDMVDLKERETAAAQARADEAQKTAADARTEAAKTKEAQAAAEKEALAAKAAADAAQKTAAANPADAAAQQKAVEAQKTADEKAAAVDAKKADTAAAQEKIAANESTAKADQTLADTKQKEAQTERKDIAADIQKDLNEKTAETKAAADAALASALPGYGLRVVDDKTFLAELVLVNLNTGSVMKTSSLNSIRNRTLLDTGAGLMAIAGKKSGSGAVKLVLIDPITLEVSKEGADVIAETSMLVQSANDYYAVIELNGKSFVGRFDKNLEAKAKSAVEVKPQTAITVTAKGVLVQESGGKIQLLRATDLVSQSK